MPGPSGHGRAQPNPCPSHPLRSPRQASQWTLASEDCPTPTDISCPTEHRLPLSFRGPGWWQVGPPLAVVVGEGQLAPPDSEGGGGAQSHLKASQEEVLLRGSQPSILESGLPQPSSGFPKPRSKFEGHRTHCMSPWGASQGEGQSPPALGSLQSADSSRCDGGTGRENNVARSGTCLHLLCHGGSQVLAGSVNLG